MSGRWWSVEGHIFCAYLFYPPFPVARFVYELAFANFFLPWILLKCISPYAKHKSRIQYVYDYIQISCGTVTLMIWVFFFFFFFLSFDFFSIFLRERETVRITVPRLIFKSWYFQQFIHFYIFFMYNTYSHQQFDFIY
jgi:hypothetical protein